MKRLKKILFFMLCALVTTFVFSVTSAKAVDVAVCELDFTTASTKNSNYANTWTYQDSKVDDTWNISGGANNNGGWSYVKLGGSKSNLNTLNDIYLSSPKVSQVTSKLTVNIAGGSLSQTGMHLESWWIFVYSDEELTTEIDRLEGGEITKSAELYTFTPTNGTTWPANSYFKVKFNVTNSTTKNGIICLEKVSIYETQEEKKYTVTFDSNGGSEVSSCEVVEGGKIDEPVSPTRDGYKFEGWHIGDKLWDFEQDVVNEDITLTAQWYENKLEKKIELLHSVDAYMSMAFKYRYNIAPKDTINYESLVFESESTGYHNFSVESSTTSAVYSGNANAGVNYIQLRSSNNNSGIVTTESGGNAKKIKITWHSNNTSGRIVEVFGSNTAYQSAADLYKAKTQGKLLKEFVYDANTLSDEFSLEEGNYEYIGIRSKSGALYLDSIEISWGETTFKDVDFRVKVAVDSKIKETLTELDNAKCGIYVTDGERTQYFDSESELYVEEDGKAYVIIDLGDVLNNTDRITNELTVQAYFEYNEEVYLSTLSKTYSVETLVDTYSKMNLDEESQALVNNLKSVLELLGYTFN